MPSEFFIPLSGVLLTQSQHDEQDEKDSKPQSKLQQQYIMQSRIQDVAAEDEDALVTQVEELSDRLTSSALCIIEPENFDLLYSLSSSFSLCPGDQLKRLVLQVISQGMTSVVKAAKMYIKGKEKQSATPVAAVKAESDDEAEEDDSTQQSLGGDMSVLYRSSIKMYAFLLTTIINQQEKAEKDGGAGISAGVDGDEEDAVPMKGKKKATAGGKKKASSSSSSSSSFDWLLQKERVIGSLVEMLSERSVYSLWRMSSPEEEFGGMILTSVMTLLEVPENSKSKSGVRDGMFTLLAWVMYKFTSLQSRAASMFVHALQHCEVLAQPFSEAMSLCLSSPFKITTFLREVLAEIAELDGAMIAKDASGARGLSSFLISLASLSPRAMHANLPTLQAQLEAESYVIRNGCVQAMAQLCESMEKIGLKEGNGGKEKEEEKKDESSKSKKKNKKRSEDDDDDSSSDQDDNMSDTEAQEKAAVVKAATGNASTEEPLNSTTARLNILTILFSRRNDINAFTRTKVLQQLVILVRARAIPTPECYVECAKAGAERLMDKTASVRKSAIQLLTAVMECQPFAPVLNQELFERKLKEKLGEFKERIEAQQGVAVGEESKQQEVIQEEDEENEDDDEDEEVAEEDEEMEPGMEGEVKVQKKKAKKSGVINKKHTSSQAVSSLPPQVQHDNSPLTVQSMKALLSLTQVNNLELTKLRTSIESLFHAINFIQTLLQGIPTLSEMFQSKQQSDATEAIAFFVVAKEFGLSVGISEAVVVGADSSAAASSSSSKALTVDSACSSMSSLIWSRELSTRDAILQAWQRLYLHPDLAAPKGSPQHKRGALMSVNSFVQLILSGSMSSLTNLEEICTKLFYNSTIPSVMIETVWELFASDASSPTVKSALLTLASYFSNASGFIISSHIEELIQHGLSSQALNHSPALVRSVCIALQKWNHAIKTAATSAQTPPAMTPAVKEVIMQRFSVLLQHTSNTSVRAAEQWYSMCEQVVNTIFLFHTKPEKFMEQVVHQIAPTVFMKTTSCEANGNGGETGLGNAEKLSRFLFILAHTGMRTLIHLETLEKDIKLLKSKQEAKKKPPQIETERIGIDDESTTTVKGKKKSPTATKAKSKAKAAKGKKKKAGSDDDSEVEEEVSEEEPASEEEEEEEKPAPKKRATKKTAESASSSSAPTTSIEDDFATTASAEYELEQSISEAESLLICTQSSSSSLLSLYGPIVGTIVRNLHKYAAHSNLQVNAVMALCKLMSINIRYCMENLNLLFSVLQSKYTTNATIKGNIIISLGDLFLRFPNEIDPYSACMYHGLKKTITRDMIKGEKKLTSQQLLQLQRDETYVRTNTLMVLTHLILNDMMKPKESISDIAICTQDLDESTGEPTRIAELSRAFFQELDKKTQSMATINNILPEILSRLSIDHTVTESQFQGIFKFLLAFIQKEKMIEGMIEKLLKRLETLYVEPVVALNQHVGSGDSEDGAEKPPAVAGDATMSDAIVAAPVAADATPVTSSSTSTPPAVATELTSAQSALLKQVRDLSYCLTQLPFSLTSLKKLREHYRCYATKLGDRQVYDAFMSILQKVRKSFGKEKEGKDGGVSSASSASKEKDFPEMKSLCDELETRYLEAHTQLVEEAHTTAKAKNVRSKKAYQSEKTKGEEEEKKRDMEDGGEESEEEVIVTAPKRKGGKIAAAPKKKSSAAPSKSRRKVVESEDEEDDEEVESEEEDEEEQEEVKPKKGRSTNSRSTAAPSKKSTAAPSKSRRKKIVDSEEDDE